MLGRLGRVGTAGMCLREQDKHIKEQCWGDMSVSVERDATLQSALNKNEVIHHKTRIDFPYIDESMQITQFYNKTTRVVMCCEIPWDVAARRTGRDVYAREHECIMLWPDKSLDLYRWFPDIKWIRKICDVGVEFDIVWDKLWEYHGLRGVDGVEALPAGPPVHVPTPESPFRSQDASLGHTHLTEIAQMRGLLEEMGRLRADGDGQHAGEAPTNVTQPEESRGVVKKILDGASSMWNHTMKMSPGFVADRLQAVLRVCGTRLDLSAKDLEQERARWRKADQNRVIQPGLKKRMARLEEALRGGSAKYHSFVYGRMKNDFDDAIKRLTGVKDYEKALAHLKTMKSDALAMNLIA
jgi:hypothetical protein